MLMHMEAQDGASMLHMELHAAAHGRSGAPLADTMVYTLLLQPSTFLESDMRTLKNINGFLLWVGALSSNAEGLKPKRGRG
jgi:hypothetical protein